MARKHVRPSDLEISAQTNWALAVSLSKELSKAYYDLNRFRDDYYDLRKICEAKGVDLPFRHRKPRAANRSSAHLSSRVADDASPDRGRQAQG